MRIPRPTLSEKRSRRSPLFYFLGAYSLAQAPSAVSPVRHSREGNETRPRYDAAPPPPTSIDESDCWRQHTAVADEGGSCFLRASERVPAAAAEGSDRTERGVRRGATKTGSVSRLEIGRVARLRDMKKKTALAPNLSHRKGI